MAEGEKKEDEVIPGSLKDLRKQLINKHNEFNSAVEKVRRNMNILSGDINEVIDTATFLEYFGKNYLEF